jgi:hypothetical protein
VIDEVEQAVVRPVQVLEDEDQRISLGESLEESAPGCERLRLAVGAGLGRLLGKADERAEVVLHPLRIRGVLDELGDDVSEFPLRFLLRIGLEDAGVGLHHLAEGPVGHALAVGKATPLAPEDELGQDVDRREQLGDEPALADPRDADERDELRRLLLRCSLEGASKQVELLVAPHEERAAGPPNVHSEARPRIDGLPDRDRLGLALGFDGIVIQIRDCLSGRAARRLVDEDSVGRSGGLQARRRVDDVARRHSLTLRRPGPQRDERLAGGDSDPQLELALLANPVTDGKSRPHCALWVVLVGGRRAKERHHRVADELLDGASALLELAPQT